MILDYITPNGNYDGLFSSGGLRICHVDATLANDACNLLVEGGQSCSSADVAQ